MENNFTEDEMTELEDQEREEIYKDNLERQQKEFFIDRDGNIIRYTGDMYEEIISMHNEIAAQVFPNDQYAEDKLMKLGYVMVGSTVYTSPIIEIKPSYKQIKTLINNNLYNRFCILMNGYYVNYEEYYAKTHPND